MNARIESVIDLDVELEFEVAVLLGSAEERVGASLRRLSHNAPIFDPIRGRTVLLDPPMKRLAIEERNPP